MHISSVLLQSVMGVKSRTTLFTNKSFLILMNSSVSYNRTALLVLKITITTFKPARGLLDGHVLGLVLQLLLGLRLLRAIMCLE